MTQDEKTAVMNSRYFSQGNTATLMDLSISTRFDVSRLSRVLDDLIDAGLVEQTSEGRFKSRSRARDLAFGRWPHQA